MAVGRQQQVLQVPVPHPEDVRDDAVARAGFDVRVHGLLADAERGAGVRVVGAEVGEDAAAVLGGDG